MEGEGGLCDDLKVLSLRMNKREVLCPKTRLERKLILKSVMDINLLPFSYLDYLSFESFLYCVFPLLWETTMPETESLLNDRKTVLRNIFGILSRRVILRARLELSPDWDFSLYCSFASFPLPPLVAPPDSQEAATPSD